MSLLNIVTCWWRRPVLEPVRPADTDMVTLVVERDELREANDRLTQLLADRGRELLDADQRLADRDQQIRELGKRLRRAEDRADLAESLSVERRPLKYEPGRPPAYPRDAQAVIDQLTRNLEAMQQRLAVAEGRAGQVILG